MEPQFLRAYVLKVDAAVKRITLSRVTRQARRLASFTLIELLTVMAIIAILAALTLAAASGVMNQAARKRAASEIQAMSTALESYKTDNGIYPVGNTTAGTASILTGPPGGTYPLDPTGAGYQNASEALYQALSGQKFFGDTPGSVGKSYMSFKVNQVAVPNGPLSYVKDPWSYSYGYSTGSPKTPATAADPAPYNGAGFFDLWSTGGTKGLKATDANTWISNWQ
jgi:prepilin-type N-terminal cleavage/methylation domain-containing protein